MGNERAFCKKYRDVLFMFEAEERCLETTPILGSLIFFAKKSSEGV